jgi:hypothetical protein
MSRHLDRTPEAAQEILERETGIEPATNGLGSRYSTIELLPLAPSTPRLSSVSEPATPNHNDTTLSLSQHAFLVNDTRPAATFTRVTLSLSR